LAGKHGSLTVEVACEVFRSPAVFVAVVDPSNHFQECPPPEPGRKREERKGVKVLSIGVQNMDRRIRSRTREISFDFMSFKSLGQ
jgi:hypothetical protein